MKYYSKSEKRVVDLTLDDLNAISETYFGSDRVAFGGDLPEDILQAVAMEAYDLVPCINLYVYGSLLNGEPAESLLFKSYPLVKQETGYFSNFKLYTHPDVNYPAGVVSASSDDRVYMEQYAVSVPLFRKLLHYEGYPKLYNCVPFHNGVVFTYNQSLEGWEPLPGNNHDWRQR